MQKRPQEKLQSLQSGPWPGSKGWGDVDWPIPAMVITDGEGGVVRELQEIVAHLQGGLGGTRGGRRSTAAKAQGGEGAPAGKRWQEIAGELH